MRKTHNASSRSLVRLKFSWAELKKVRVSLAKEKRDINREKSDM